MRLTGTGTRGVSRRGLLAGSGAAIGFLCGSLLLPTRAQAADYATGDMVLGDPDAPVEVIEYASMTCPHCRSFHETVFPLLKSRFIDTGMVRFVFREFPLDRYALMASMLARCGGEQRYFAIIDVLFSQQPNWTRVSDPVAALREIGISEGVPAEAFDACMTDESLADMIMNTRLDGHQRLNVNGTPTVFVNGEEVGNAHDFEELAAHIERTI